jgi:hypothetical protein
MSTTSVPFQSVTRPDLSLKRRDHSTSPIPMEADDIIPRERRMSGPYGQASLQEAWDKLYRARAILEAEQAHLRDDRIALQGGIESLDNREQALSARETWIRQYESQVALEQAEAEVAKESASTIARLTRAPFDMARSVFGHKK